MHNNNYQCKICWNKALTFGVGSIQLSFRTMHCVHPKHAKVFSIQMLQSNCAEGLHFSAFHYNRDSLLVVNCEGVEHPKSEIKYIFKLRTYLLNYTLPK